MSRPIARDRNGVRYTPDLETGEWRPLTSDENGSIVPIGILDEQGVTNGERFTIKNLAPSAGLAMLRLRGYEAVQYGDGQNFAVRRSPEDPWRLVDPAKGGFEEFWKDMVDLLGDVAVGAATVAGTAAGGGLASIGTGAAAGAGAEIVRQNLARAAGGLPPGIDLPEVAGSAIGGAIAPPVGRLLGGAVRGAVKGVAKFTKAGGPLGRAGEAFTTKLADIKPAFGVEVSEQLTERGVTMPRPLFTPEAHIGIIRRHLDEVATPLIKNLTTIRDNAVKKGMTFDLRPFARGMQENMGILKPSGKLRVFAPEKAALQQQLVAALEYPSRSQIAAAMQAQAGAAVKPTLFGATGLQVSGGVKAVSPKAVDEAFIIAVAKWKAKLARTPMRVMMRTKKVLQNEIARQKGFGAVGVDAPGAAPVPIKPEENALLRGFTSKLTKAMHNRLSKLGRDGKSVVFHDKLISDKMRARGAMRKFFGPRPPDVRDPSVANIRSVLKSNRSDLRLVLKEYDRVFPGVQFRKLATEAATAGQVIPKSFTEGARQLNNAQQFTEVAGDPTEFGLPGTFGKFTATGGIFGASLVGGAIGGATGGREGVLPGLAAGAAAPFLFTPAMIVRLSRNLGQLNSGVSRMATGVDKVLMTKMLREATTLLATTAAQSTGRRIASQDSKGRRRALFIGQ